MDDYRIGMDWYRMDTGCIIYCIRGYYVHHCRLSSC